ncbi:MAG: hypothetical protein OXG88_02195 [Gammaproteobacteria bacterium]|nr:hypothetical protein [Gammaproteobacteria bacterium]
MSDKLDMQNTSFFPRTKVFERVKTFIDLVHREMRSLSRMMRFRVFCVLLVFLSVGGYLLSSQYAANLAQLSPTFGMTVPRYLLGSIDATFYLVLQVGTMYMVFDAHYRLQRDRVAEVLHSKPVSNLGFLLVRVIGTTTLIWLLVASNVVGLYLLGLFSFYTEVGYFQPFQFHSMFNLVVVDIYVVVLFWSAYVSFLSSLLSSRIVVVLISLATFLVNYLTLVNSPYFLLAVISPFSNDTLFVSEVLPNFSKVSTIGIRLATLFATGALVVGAAMIWPRNDQNSSSLKLSLITGFVVISIALWGWTFTHHVNSYDQVYRWRESHQTIEYSQKLDLNEISGNITINPGRQLMINLALSFKVQELNHNKLVFSLNPGMNVVKISLNDAESLFTFENGILEVLLPEIGIGLESLTLKIEAHGRPDPRFAYIDSSVELFRSSNVPLSAVKLFGKDGSVFTPQYVALMPGVAWYPVTGVMVEKSIEKIIPTDFFNVDLVVEIIHEHWSLVGTGQTNKIRQTQNSYRVYSTNPVAQIGVFAAEFQTIPLNVVGSETEVYLHTLRESGQEMSDESIATLQKSVKLWLREITNNGLTLPRSTINLVEIPSRLRTVGGGWRMGARNTLPGVVLFKEFGLPSLSLDSVSRKLPNDLVVTKEQMLINFLNHYIRNGLGTDNLWLDTPDLFFAHVTAATGSYAEELDQIIRNIIGSLGNTPFESFNIYSTIHVAPLTEINRNVIRSTPVYSRLSIDHIGHRQTFLYIKALEIEYGSRMAVWDLAEKHGFLYNSTILGHQQELELFLFKTREIAKAILETNDKQAVVGWIKAIRELSLGRSYTYEEVIKLAKQHKVTAEPFLTQWITDRGLPGFMARFTEISQIKENSNGTQRFQSTIDVHNATPLSGLITLRYRNAPTYGVVSSVASYTPVTPIVVPAFETKSINLIANYPIEAVIINPHLSLNRTNIYLLKQYKHTQGQASLDPKPFLLSSKWIPVESGIVIDDLDSDFSFSQPRNSFALNHVKQIGPMKWVFGFQQQLDYDSALPTIDTIGTQQVHRDSWYRVSSLRAFGRFRRTFVALDRFTPQHKVSIRAEIPTSGTWMLQYHLPSTASNLFDNKSNTIQLNINSKEVHIGKQVSLDSMTRGWNQIGSFKLSSGRVKVEITGTSANTPIIVDAIQWSPVLLPKNAVD